MSGSHIRTVVGDWTWTYLAGVAYLAVTVAYAVIS